ncbi:hypothetical protein M406DRAFT_67994 [Cryphonectria parasitica EP155]|uniref:Uncharacterized protein n=1 Tax=Cryphonectria parasitica (strain ATCC 38755 / EP155) TaxID=660469 RepID=A0A9P4Y2R3_CRYP1|nr:uncharacterized protein M406DRAFT_67994 [Cryphonectria parasitica EP155]KAF3765568.1 hypothetical protein M406DRAFT_67994 [Cryphonectria parasitica EP155]
MAMRKVDGIMNTELVNKVTKEAAVNATANHPGSGKGLAISPDNNTHYKMPQPSQPAVQEQPQLISLVDTSTDNSSSPNGFLYSNVTSSASMQDLSILDPETFALSPDKMENSTEPQQQHSTMKQMLPSSDTHQNTAPLPKATLAGEAGLNKILLENSPQEQASQKQASEPVPANTAAGSQQATSGLLAGAGASCLEETIEAYLTSIDTDHLVSLLARAGRLQDLERAMGGSSWPQPAVTSNRRITHAESKQWVQRFQGFTARRLNKMSQMDKQ